MREYNATWTVGIETAVLRPYCSDDITPPFVAAIQYLKCKLYDGPIGNFEDIHVIGGEYLALEIRQKNSPIHHFRFLLLIQHENDEALFRLKFDGELVRIS